MLSLKALNENLVTNIASHHVANGNGNPNIGEVFPIMSP